MRGTLWDLPRFVLRYFQAYFVDFFRLFWGLEMCLFPFINLQWAGCCVCLNYASTLKLAKTLIHKMLIFDSKMLKTETVLRTVLLPNKLFFLAYQWSITTPYSCNIERDGSGFEEWYSWDFNKNSDLATALPKGIEIRIW